MLSEPRSHPEPATVVFSHGHAEHHCRACDRVIVPTDDPTQAPADAHACTRADPSTSAALPASRRPGAPTVVHLPEPVAAGGTP